MAVTLAQAAVLSQNQLQRGVIETFVQLSPVLDRLPLIEIQGNAYAYDSEGTLPGIAFRLVNEAYTESTGVVNQTTESLVIMGGDADVDRFIVQTRGNLNDQRAVQTRLKVKAASYFFQDNFFNGDVSVNAKAFDGLKKRSPARRSWLPAPTASRSSATAPPTRRRSSTSSTTSSRPCPASTAPTARSTPTPRSWRRSAPLAAASVAWTRSVRT
jgi:hypothetical protein